MKRDLDLIRTMLQRIEAATPGQLTMDHLKIDGVDRDVVTYHAVLLHDADLIVGHFLSSQQSDLPIAYTIERLSWKGHEHLDAVRDPDTWKKTKEKLGEKLASVTIDVVAAVAVGITKAQLGIS